MINTQRRLRFLNGYLVLFCFFFFWFIIKIRLRGNLYYNRLIFWELLAFVIDRDPSDTTWIMIKHANMSNIRNDWENSGTYCSISVSFIRISGSSFWNISHIAPYGQKSFKSQILCVEELHLLYHVFIFIVFIIAIVSL